MGSYRITNRMRAAVRLEDIGVHLQPAGGKDASCTVAEHIYLASSDVRRHAGWLKVEYVPDARPVPAPAAQAPPALLPPPAAPAPADTGDQHPLAADVKFLKGAVEEMNANLAALVRLMENRPSDHVYVASFPGAADRPFSPTAQSDVPFIPSVIVPKDAETHISVQEKDSSDEGFDESAAALRNLRRKQK